MDCYRRLWLLLFVCCTRYGTTKDMFSTRSVSNDEVKDLSFLNSNYWNEKFKPDNKNDLDSEFVDKKINDLLVGDEDIFTEYNNIFVEVGEIELIQDKLNKILYTTKVNYNITQVLDKELPYIFGIYGIKYNINFLNELNGIKVGRIRSYLKRSLMSLDKNNKVFNKKNIKLKTNENYIKFKDDNKESESESESGCDNDDGNSIFSKFKKKAVNVKKGLKSKKKISNNDLGQKLTSDSINGIDNENSSSSEDDMNCSRIDAFKKIEKLKFPYHQDENEPYNVVTSLREINEIMQRQEGYNVILIKNRNALDGLEKICVQKGFFGEGDDLLKNQIVKSLWANKDASFLNWLGIGSKKGSWELQSSMNDQNDIEEEEMKSIVFDEKESLYRYGKATNKNVLKQHVQKPFYHQMQPVKPIGCSSKTNYDMIKASNGMDHLNERDSRNIKLKEINNNSDVKQHNMSEYAMHVYALESMAKMNNDEINKDYSQYPMDKIILEKRDDSIGRVNMIAKKDIMGYNDRKYVSKRSTINLDKDKTSNQDKSINKKNIIKKNKSLGKWECKYCKILNSNCYLSCYICTIKQRIVIDDKIYMISLPCEE